MIITKLVLLIYLGGAYALSSITSVTWYVLVLLIYLCLNILFYIFKKENIKKFVLLVTLITIAYSSANVYPYLIVLLPLNLLELVDYFTHKKWLMLTMTLIPELFISEDLYMVYGLVALLCFIIFIMVKIYTERLTKYIGETDDMRKAVNRLSKSLNENKEFIRQSKYTYSLEERNRISQEIHDKIGHSMTGALIQMEAAKHIVETDRNQAIKLLQNAINISKDGIEQIRQTLQNIKPPAEQMGINRIRLIIDEFTSKHSIQTSLTYKGNLDIITPIQWKIIIENLGEALTNTLKYASATTVSIDIQVLNKFVKVEVKDNGKGEHKITKGLGITGMEERAAAINGKVIVDGSKAFVVTTLLPIDE